MKQHNSSPAAGLNRREGLIALMGAVAALSGCGGGEAVILTGDLASVASVGSGGTGSLSNGVITGFGSIIVNGVRFDDSHAAITDDQGAAHSSSDLKLGMVVSITASTIATDATGSSATASTITFHSELRGPIDSIGSQSIVVLGQTVQITAATIFDGGIVGGIAGLGVGQIVEVHGFVDPVANRITATRIERESGPVNNKLQGQVQSLNTTARTFVIGALTVSYAGIPAAALPANLANGLLVRVELAALPSGGGTRSAVNVRPVAVKVEDHEEAELDGTVTAFTSITSFSLNGTPVDASKATFPNGTTNLKLGARVEVTGSISNGVLVATSVQVESDREVNGQQQFELHGTVSNLNTSSKTFVVRGVTVGYAGAVRFDNGDASRLVVGGRVGVKGTYDAANNSVTATRINFEG